MNGSELRQALSRNKVSIGDLAEKMEMSQPNLSNQFKVQDVKTGILERICDVLGVTLDFFYAGTKYMPNEYPKKEQDFFVSEDIGRKTLHRDDEIMFLKGQVKALKEMNQMLIGRNSNMESAMDYRKKNA